MNVKASHVKSTREQEFYWSEEREPHFGRRKQILKDHPEIKKLFGINPRLKYVTVALVLVQFTVAFFANQLSLIPFLLVTYFVGATIAQALFLAVHEITHYLAFKSKKANNWLAIFANLPIVAPFAISFQIYHAKHHWDQGKEHVDTDIPTYAEANFFKGVLGKLVWSLNQMLFYAFRPLFVHPIKLEKWQIYNIIFQVTAMAIILPFVGWAGLGYLLLSLLFAGSIHPTAGHFISEHYVFKEGQETYSYYGPLNKITFNVGYHNEHHDFPQIPGSRLPELKKLAPEYYDPLLSYNSWVKLLISFIFNKEISLFSRVKRK